MVIAFGSLPQWSFDRPEDPARGILDLTNSVTTFAQLSPLDPCFEDGDGFCDTISEKVELWITQSMDPLVWACSCGL